VCGGGGVDTGGRGGELGVCLWWGATGGVVSVCHFLRFELEEFRERFECGVSKVGYVGA